MSRLMLTILLVLALPNFMVAYAASPAATLCQTYIRQHDLFEKKLEKANKDKKLDVLTELATVINSCMDADSCSPNQGFDYNSSTHQCLEWLTTQSFKTNLAVQEVKHLSSNRPDNSSLSTFNPKPHHPRKILYQAPLTHRTQWRPSGVTVPRTPEEEPSTRDSSHDSNSVSDQQSINWF